MGGLLGAEAGLMSLVEEVELQDQAEGVEGNP